MGQSDDRQAGVLGLLGELGAERCILWIDNAVGLRAVAVVDDVTLGPAAGGIRTRSYGSLEAAIRDAAALARAMTVKCALGGLDAGGCKIVVIDHPGMNRPAAFERLGRFVDELGGLVRTAGDLGTTEADLTLAAKHTRYVHLGEAQLAASVARGLLRCVEACVAHRGDDPASLSGLKVAVQGCGAMGAAVAQALDAAGARLLLADLDETRARRLCEQLGDAAVVPAKSVLAEPVDVVAPCAVGGVMTHQSAAQVRAWAVVGAANNVLAEPSVAEALAARSVLFVPDPISSAGAVIDGVGRTVMGMADRSQLIDQLGDTARSVLSQAAESGRTTVEVANQLARQRIAAGRRSA